MTNTRVFVTSPESTGPGAYCVSTFSTLASGGIDYVITFLDFAVSQTTEGFASQCATQHNNYATIHSYSITELHHWFGDVVTNTFQGQMSTTHKSKIDALVPGVHIVDSSGSAAIDAVVNLATNFTALSALAGLATGLNGANDAQNNLAAKYNDLAAKYNDLSTKFNLLLDRLESHTLLATS